MKKHKTTARLLSALVVLLLLFPLSACAPAEPYGIYVGMSGKEYCAAIPAELAVDQWIGQREDGNYSRIYECFQSEDVKVVVVERDYIRDILPDGRIVGGGVIDILVCDSVTPRNATYLQEHLREGMTFPQVVELAGLPKVNIEQGKSHDIILFPTDGDALLRTEWTSSIWAKSATLTEFELFTPDTSTNSYGIYEGMSVDECLAAFLPLKDRSHCTLGMCHFTNQNGDLVVLKPTIGKHPQDYIENIYVVKPGEIKSVAYLQEHLQTGMTFFEVVELAGCPISSLAPSGDYINTFVTDGEELLQTGWDCVTLSDGTTEWQIDYIRFYKPDN